MNEFADIYNQLADNPRLIQRWQNEVIKRVRWFVRKLAKASPFLDKPQKSLFGIRKDKTGDSLTIFGTSPNAGRMKTFNAPVNEWVEERRYFRVLGRSGNRKGKWATIHKTQLVRKSMGVGAQDVPYYGTSEKPEKYFGIKKGRVTIAYGKTKSGIALPVYADESFADWIMRRHITEIDDIVLEAGRNVLAESLRNGGKK